MKHGEQPGRQSSRTGRQGCGWELGFPPEHSTCPGDEWDDCFWVSNLNPKQRFSPRPSLRNSTQTICTISVIKRENYFLGDASLSLLKTRQGWGRSGIITRAEHPSLLSPLHHHMQSLCNTPGEALIIALKLKTLYMLTYARLAVCLQKAPQTQTDPAWSGLTCFYFFTPSILPVLIQPLHELGACKNKEHGMGHSSHGGPAPPTQLTCLPTSSIPSSSRLPWPLPDPGPQQPG